MPRRPLPRRAWSVVGLAAPSATSPKRRTASSARPSSRSAWAKAARRAAPRSSPMPRRRSSASLPASRARQPPGAAGGPNLVDLAVGEGAVVAAAAEAGALRRRLRARKALPASGQPRLVGTDVSDAEWVWRLGGAQQAVRLIEVGPGTLALARHIAQHPPQCQAGGLQPAGIAHLGFPRSLARCLHRVAQVAGSPQRQCQRPVRRQLIPSAHRAVASARPPGSAGRLRRGPTARRGKRQGPR